MEACVQGRWVAVEARREALLLAFPRAAGEAPALRPIYTRAREAPDAEYVLEVAEEPPLFTRLLELCLQPPLGRLCLQRSSLEDRHVLSRGKHAQGGF